MKSITTLFNLPKFIQQQFNAALLSSPSPKFRETLSVFDFMWKAIESKWRKLDKTPNKKAICEALKKEMLQIYERAKVKEEEREKEKDHKTQGFMYTVSGLTRMAQDVYARLRFGRKAGDYSPYKWKNHAIHETKRGRIKK